MSGYKPGVRDADDGIHVLERSNEKFVGQNACGVFEAEETVISEYCADPHEMRMQNAFMANRRKASVRMN
jgi:hypothetical protein